MLSHEVQEKLAADGSYLSHFKLAKKINKSGVSYSQSIKIAILSSFTSDPLIPCLEAECAAKDITLRTYQCPYARFQHDIIDVNSDLYTFEADIIIVLVDAKSSLPHLFDAPYQLSLAQRSAKTDKGLADSIGLMQSLRESTQALIMVCNYVEQAPFELGILEATQPAGILTSIKKANILLQEKIAQMPNSYVLDLNFIAAHLGYQYSFDAKLEHFGDIRLGMELFAALSVQVMGAILPYLGKIKKCLVLDLDNTLWGGIVGEDGWENVQIGNDNADGRAFYQFQKMLLRYQQRGLILALNSKNNTQDALDVFEKREEMILQKAHFAVMRINWQDKAQNLKEIAKSLNIGLDSLIFFDDSPQERGVIKEYLPQVLVPEMTHPNHYVQILTHLVELNVLTLTEEDKLKAKMYAAQSSRNNLKETATDLTDFLVSLQTKATIMEAIPGQYPRLSQLSQKTNQFNLTTRRYSESIIQDFAEAKEAKVYSLSMQDKFGDLGLVGLAIWQQQSKNRWELDTFLLSCRCLGRHAEHAFLAWQMAQLQENGATDFCLQYLKTKKNAPMKKFIDGLQWSAEEYFQYAQTSTKNTLTIPDWITVN